MDNRLGRRSTSALFELLVGIVKLGTDRPARDQLIRFIAGEFNVGRRDLAGRIGLSHASVVRILKKQQGRGETGTRSRAAAARERRNRRRRS